MGNLITKYENFIFEADSPSTVLSAARLELQNALDLDAFAKDRYNSDLRAVKAKPNQIKAEIKYLTSRIACFQKVIPALAKLKSAIDGRLAELNESRIIGYDNFILEAEETAASIVSAAKLEQSKVVGEWKSIVKKYREDKTAAAGDEAKELKLESEYTAKRSQYYQKLVQAVTEVKTALEAELSELSQA